MDFHVLYNSAAGAQKGWFRMHLTRRSLGFLPFAGAQFLSGQTTSLQRGVVVGPTLAIQDIPVLADWGANVVRFEMINPEGFDKKDQDFSRYRTWWNQRLDYLDILLPTFEQYKIKVIIDMHVPPGDAVEDAGHVIFYNRTLYEGFQAIWESTARRYLWNPTVYAFDLLNEPKYNVKRKPSMISSWETLATSTIERIRKVDLNRTVCFQPFRAEPGRFDGLDRLSPRKVLYSLHMYNPLSFTHQGIGSRPMGVKYPDGKDFNKSHLYAALKPARDFQQRYDVGIYVGEFSVNLQIETMLDYGLASAYNYLNDCISIFEEYGWRWTYHGVAEDPRYWALAARHEITRNLLINSMRRNNRAAVMDPAP